MRVLVTGASGFVGRHLVSALTAHGHRVTAWSYSGVPAPEGIEYRVIDMCDGDAVGREDMRGLDAIIHLAALAQVGDSFSAPATYISTNASMEANLMETVIRQACAPRVLIVSTGGVYQDGNLVLTETSPIEPSNPYVISKLTQEMLGAYYATRGCDVVVARPFNHIGPGQQRGYLVADVASQIAEIEQVGGGVVSVGNLTSERDYTDVRDVVAAYMSLLVGGRPGETYNVCRGRSLSGEDIVRALRELTDVDFEVERSPGVRPTDGSRVRASSAKISKETGWSPAIDIDQTLADTLDYWRTRSR